MSDQTLTLRADTASASVALDRMTGRLLEQFPEAGLDLIQGLLLRAFHDGSVFALCATPVAGDRVVRLQVCLDTVRISEFCAAALRAGQGNRVAHGQSPFGNG